MGNYLAGPCQEEIVTDDKSEDTAIHTFQDLEGSKKVGGFATLLLLVGTEGTEKNEGTIIRRGNKKLLQGSM